MVSIGSNSFLGVPFPLAIGNRYVHVGPSSGGTPTVKVFRWDEDDRKATEEAPSSSSSALTWDHDSTSGGIRLKVNSHNASDITGYVSGGPLDAIAVVITDSFIEVSSGDRPIATFAGNVMSGFAVGLAVDPTTAAVSLGSSLPQGFEYCLRHENETIRIAMMVQPEAPILSNREFVNCRIEGPALLGQAGTLDISDCRFDMQGADLGSLVWEVPPTNQAYGSVLLTNVSFHGCDFVAVAIAAAKGQRESLLRQLTQADE